MQKQLIKSILLVYSIVVLPSFAQTSCQDAFIRVARMIYQNDFQTGRGLDHYRMAFPSAFGKNLNALSPTSHWIDMGAGQGLAQLEYLSQDGQAQVTAIALKRAPVSTRRHLKIHEPKLNYLEGRFFEKIPLKELPKAKLITDVFGIFTYSFTPDVVLQKYLDLLEPQGTILLHFPNTSTVSLPNQKEIKIEDWIRSIPGIKIKTLSESAFTQNISLQITKTKTRVKVQKLGLLDIEDHAMPPIRRLTSDL